MFANIDPYRPGERVIIRPAHDSRRAVRRERDGSALSCSFDRTGADQLTALLSPDVAVPDEDPRRPGAPVVVRPTHDSSVTVAGKRDRHAFSSLPNRTGADQLVALLGPNRPPAGENPYRAVKPVVQKSTDNGGSTIGGQCDGPALVRRINRA